jgi:hypothetical protein
MDQLLAKSCKQIDALLLEAHAIGLMASTDTVAIDAREKIMALERAASMMQQEHDKAITAKNETIRALQSDLSRVRQQKEEEITKARQDAIMNTTKELASQFANTQVNKKEDERDKLRQEIIDLNNKHDIALKNTQLLIRNLESQILTEQRAKAEDIAKVKNNATTVAMQEMADRFMQAGAEKQEEQAKRIAAESRALHAETEQKKLMDQLLEHQKALTNPAKIGTKNEQTVLSWLTERLGDTLWEIKDVSKTEHGHQGDMIIKTHDDITIMIDPKWRSPTERKVSNAAIKNFLANVDQMRPDGAILFSNITVADHDNSCTIFNRESIPVAYIGHQKWDSLLRTIIFFIAKKQAQKMLENGPKNIGIFDPKLAENMVREFAFMYDSFKTVGKTWEQFAKEWPSHHSFIKQQLATANSANLNQVPLTVIQAWEPIVPPPKRGQPKKYDPNANSEEKDEKDETEQKKPIKRKQKDTPQTKTPKKQKHPKQKN